MSLVMRARPLVAGLAAWVVGAATAVGVGLISLTLIGGGVTEGPFQQLTQSAVPVATQPSLPVPENSADATPTPGPSADRTISTQGGSVVAECRDGQAYLVGWSPAPGYKASDIKRGPAATAKLEFEGHERKVKVSVVCSAGVILPTIEVESEEDHPETPDR
jgi:hypothetical protein